MKEYDIAFLKGLRESAISQGYSGDVIKDLNNQIREKEESLKTENEETENERTV